MAAAPPDPAAQYGTNTDAHREGSFKTAQNHLPIVQNQLLMHHNVREVGESVCFTVKHLINKWVYTGSLDAVFGMVQLVVGGTPDLHHAVCTMGCVCGHVVPAISSCVARYTDHRE